MRSGITTSSSQRGRYGRDPVGELGDVTDVHRLPAVEHQVVVVTESLAQRAHQCDVRVQTVIAAGRAVPEEPFLRR